jgi:hypothetical protein
MNPVTTENKTRRINCTSEIDVCLWGEGRVSSSFRHCMYGFSEWSCKAFHLKCVHVSYLPCVQTGAVHFVFIYVLTLIILGEEYELWSCLISVLEMGILKVPVYFLKAFQVYTARKMEKVKEDIVYIDKYKQKKGKAVPQHTPWRRRGEKRYSSCSFLTSALDGSEWSASRPGPGKGPPVRIGQEAGWAPEPVWTQRLEENTLCLHRDRTCIARTSSP